MMCKADPTIAASSILKISNSGMWSVSREVARIFFAHTLLFRSGGESRDRDRIFLTSRPRSCTAPTVIIGFNKVYGRFPLRHRSISNNGRLAALRTLRGHFIASMHHTISISSLLYLILHTLRYLRALSLSFESINALIDLDREDVLYGDREDLHISSMIMRRRPLGGARLHRRRQGKLPLHES